MAEQRILFEKLESMVIDMWLGVATQLLHSFDLDYNDAERVEVTGKL